MIKTVITAGGKGTRLLTVTKELPKEMLPIFSLDYLGNLCVKPLFEEIFHQSFLLGIRKFCIIVGKQKRTIEDHFTPDSSFINEISVKQYSVAQDLKILYERISKSSINWVNQLGSHGFGHAVLMAETFVGDDDFIVQAGDTLILSKDTSPLKKVMNEKLENEYDAVILVRKVDDPRRFGVATLVKENGENIVKKVVEKPKQPESNMAIMPIYRFKPSIFRMLKEIKYGKNELQLTDGIQKLIENGGKVKAIIVNKSDIILDVGTPGSFWDAQKDSMKYVKSNLR